MRYSTVGPDLAGPTPITLLPPFRAARPRAAADPTQHTIKPCTSRLILLVTMIRTLTELQPFIRDAATCPGSHGKVWSV
jgi:hypothetical protein